MSGEPIEAGRERSLVSTGWLAEHLSDPELRLFDCMTLLKPAAPGEGPYVVESGRMVYLERHIPGAGHLDLHEDLSDPESAFHFMMPSERQLATALGAAGIAADSKVVLYSSEHVMWATRIWWMLRAFGLDDVAVLDGGLAGWTEAGHPTCSEPCAYPPTALEPGGGRALFVDKEVVSSAIDSTSICTINALGTDYFRGVGQSRYGRPGRVPGSVSVPAASLLTDPHTFLGLDRAEPLLRDAGALDASEVITYCGGGISATVVNFMLYRLGVDAVTTYDASMSEWASDESLPIERDQEEAS